MLASAPSSASLARAYGSCILGRRSITLGRACAAWTTPLSGRREGMRPRPVADRLPQTQGGYHVLERRLGQARLVYRAAEEASPQVLPACSVGTIRAWPVYVIGSWGSRVERREELSVNLRLRGALIPRGGRLSVYHARPGAVTWHWAAAVRFRSTGAGRS